MIGNWWKHKKNIYQIIAKGETLKYIFKILYESKSTENSLFGDKYYWMISQPTGFIHVSGFHAKLK